jgi:pyruvate carboxylase subunit A
MLKKVLIANRGEIAVRVIRACREMGIKTVAVFSEADRGALFTRYADEAYPIGPAAAAQSYLNIATIVEKAKQSGCDAIHPGYGFLAENPALASACDDAGIVFAGPSGRVLELLGNKVAARKEMRKAGVPVVPGTDACVADFGQAKRIAEEIGYPVILKPAGGGGGIGMTIVADERSLAGSLESAKKLAGTTFGLSDIFIEKYLPNPRHIEFQILADRAGRVIHLGERECSIQRRHQKLIEESPSTALTEEMRACMGRVAVDAARWVGYQGAGTVEFLFQEGKFYFLEVNARIQVEHPVTELVTGIDIVKEQIRIASGVPLRIEQEDVVLRGNAIECRINAEDPLKDFAPAPGKISVHLPPGGPGVRVDSGACGPSIIPPYYDSMVSKLIVWGADRDEAIQRMKRALYEYVIEGIPSNIPFHRAVMENRSFVSGALGTHFIEQEKGLLHEIRRIALEAQTLKEKLNLSTTERKRIAAVAAAVACVYPRDPA